MPRDLSGNYTLPAGNPVITLTPIQTAWANPTLADIAQSITDSLDRQGRGGMLAPFKFADGTLGLPSGSFTSEPTLGFYRKGAAQFAIAVSGADIGVFGPTTFTAPAGVLATGGSLRVSRTAATAQVVVDGDAGQQSRIDFRTAGVARWLVGRDATAEGGADAGSNFVIQRFTDAGVFLGTALTVNRATGAFTFNGSSFFTAASTFQGVVSSAPAAGTAGFIISPIAGQSGIVRFQKAGVTHWQFEEDGGATAMQFKRFDDAGVLLGTPLAFTRTTGRALFENDLAASGTTITFGTNANAGQTVIVNAAPATSRNISVYSNSVLRWQLVLANATAEGGADAGSNLSFDRFTDAGGALGTVLSLTRANGNVNMPVGQLIFGDAALAATAAISYRTAAGRIRAIRFESGSLLRWQFQVDATAEGGSNAGSDLNIFNYTDAGTLISAPLSIKRSTGVVNFGVTPTVGGVSLFVPTQVFNLAANHVNATTVNTDVPGLTGIALAAGRYMLEFIFQMEASAGTTGHKLRVTTTGAAAAQHTWFCASSDASSTVFHRAAATAADAVYPNTPSPQVHQVTGRIILVLAGAGTFTVAHSANAAGTSTIDLGSMCRITTLT